MRTANDNRNCPYCLSPIERAEEKVRCPKCGVIHHSDCWKANGSCSVYGCDGWAVWTDRISESIAPDTESGVEVSESDARVAAPKEIVRCIECGKEIRQGAIICLSCRRKGSNHYFDNCFGPSIIVLGGMIGAITALVKALV